MLPSARESKQLNALASSFESVAYLAQTFEWVLVDPKHLH